MAQQSLIYSFIARDTVILVEFTDFKGNLTSIASQYLHKLPSSNNKFTGYNCNGHTFNYLVDNGFTYCVVAVDSAGMQIPMAFLERVKEDFNKRYGEGKAATAQPDSLNKEFGSKLKEHMQYCMDHPDEFSKLAKVKAQVSEVKGNNQGDFSVILGTCTSMCPERERVTRERLRDLALFERLNGNPSKTSSNLAVKKFCRTLSVSNVHPSDIRPLPVLEETLKYLLKMLDSVEQPFEVVHDFIFDRTRSIRQDLTIQNIANERVINLYEKMVKFHVISHQRLQNCTGTSIRSMQHLNMEQLAKTLISLYNIYDANRKPDYIFENEAEFRSLYVLLHLNPSNGAMGEPLSLWFRKLTSALIASKEICFVRKLLRLYRMGNYKEFLSSTASEATYLQYCTIEPYIREMRLFALQCINNVCYKLQPYPLAQLSRNLMMKEMDVKSLCHECGLETYTDSDGFTVFTAKQTSFRSSEEFKGYALLGTERLKT